MKREKTRVHEEIHVEQWSTGDWSEANGWFTVAELFEDYLDEIDNDYGDKDALVEVVIEKIRLYNRFENLDADAESHLREAEAYAAGAAEDPPYFN